ncbi:glycoside hydrolase family 3 C-terminal domain-containing protein [Labrys wisconsinensis]|uniref:Beta-glucosidase n=1 Tax=Labrys wisconsinensis TaxID=425677 RepID=A0ABU0JD40_9HYPH|nr:glycoside hydrolase family 3 C-terminal domain-containing protein [Labrys wisconsinensis]MDQ0472192.1 beta-glucosidase [Labrys wisconsinensis]
MTAFDAKTVIASLTHAEKVDLLSGFNMWKTRAIERFGIPSIVMTDGTYGVRYSVDQIDNDMKGGQDFDAFLGVVNRRANDVQTAWGTMKAATCFPNGSSLGCSWDVDLAHELGAALARECQALGVHVLLGPGINIRRTPLGGRAYEYYAEDPVLTGDIAAGVINGMQDGGVGASLKHFACNNSEVERTTMDSVVEERALREIYLLGFERAVAKSRPWTVMSAYNRLNGVQAAENHWLLTEVLREDWGFEGLVMSDWQGVKDRPASLIAGNDLDMPESSTRKEDLLAAIEAGTVPMAVVDSACERVLVLVGRALAGEDRRPCDFTAHHALARRFAAESIVLLRNEDGLLPLDPGKAGRILVIGESATEAVIQGSGCATTTPTFVDRPLDEIRRLAAQVDHVVGTSDDPARHEALRQEALAAAARADTVIVFANTIVGYDGEGSDRRDLALAPGQDALIAALAAAHPKVIVVLANPDAVAMPWLDAVGAVVETFFSGQGMGAAVADILFGRVSPSGKLTTTFPKRIEDIPGYPTYPGENGRHLYCEGIHVGYRHYDKRGIEPLFPFGFGLSYTSFAYADLTLDRTRVGPGEGLTASVSVTNTGARAGKEIVQLYLQPTAPRLQASPRNLRGFVKVALEPGETRRVRIALTARDFEAFDPARGGWVLDTDVVTVAIGASSRDIRLEARVQCDAGVVRHRPVAWDTQPIFILENPIARKAFAGFLAGKLAVNEADAERLLEHCRNSFFGIVTSLDRRLRLRFDRDEVEALIASINAGMRALEQQPALRDAAE